MSETKKFNPESSIETPNTEDLAVQRFNIFLANEMEKDPNIFTDDNKIVKVVNAIMKRLSEEDRLDAFEAFLENPDERFKGEALVALSIYKKERSKQGFYAK